MSKRAPAVRARGLRDALQLLERRNARAYAKLLERVPAETIELVASAPPTAWIDVEHERLIVDSWVPVLGESGAVELVCDAVHGTLNGPLFRSIIRGSARLLGANPGSLVKMVPRAWGHIYRDHLTATAEVAGADRAIVSFEDIAREVWEAQGYPTVWKGAFFAIFAVFDCEGEAIWDPAKDQRAGTWTLEWWPKTDR
ncbi:MAG: hypothetical protein AAF799_04990 [Myxococcota bacterium]